MSRARFVVPNIRGLLLLLLLLLFFCYYCFYCYYYYYFTITTVTFNSTALLSWKQRGASVKSDQWVCDRLYVQLSGLRVSTATHDDHDHPPRPRPPWRPRPCCCCCCCCWWWWWCCVYDDQRNYESVKRARLPPRFDSSTQTSNYLRDGQPSAISLSFTVHAFLYIQWIAFARRLLISRCRTHTALIDNHP